ncbi:MAG: FUSC family protein [Myxococcales bacterium]
MLRHVRASVQMAAARPAISLGLRAATVTVPPLVIGELTGRPGLLWMSLGGWLCALADPGGPYPLRAAAMAAYLVFGTLATILGTATYRAWASVLVLFVFGACTSLARGLGDAAATVGAIVLIMLCIAVGSPAPAGALTRGALVGAGSLLAIALALGLWPVHPYRPARAAVADCYRALADLVDALARLPSGSLAAREAAAAQAARTAPPRVRAALETARAALAAVRRGRAADTQRGEILLVLFESADLSLGSLSAAIDPLAASPGVDPSFLRPLADSFRGIALATVGRGDDAPGAPRLDEPIGHPDLHAFLEPVMITATFAAEMADALRTGKHAQPTPAPLPDAPARLPLRDQLALGSPLVRHAARMAFGLAAAGVLGQMLHLSRGYWMTVTVVIVLQPDLGSTVRRALDRVAGTVLGAVVAAVVAPLVHRPFVFGALLFPLSAVAVALRPINYALYSAFVTLVFLLISEAFSGDWHLAGVRIGTTLLGGAVALVFAFLFWPTREAERLPAQIAAMLSALRQYISAARLGGEGERAARRRFGLAAAAADASLSRLLHEPGAREEQIEAMMAALTYARRLRASVAALFAAGYEPAAARDLAGRVDAALERLASAFSEHRDPPPSPAWPTPGEPRLVALAGRVARQLEILRSALGRLSAQST